MADLDKLQLSSTVEITSEILYSLKKSTWIWNKVEDRD